MFRPSYLKEGAGIEKDAPPKRGLGLLAETLAREFWQIVKVNLLFVICALPVVTFGAARAAMARCTMRMARDVPNDVWEDFRRAIREDFAANTVCGLAELALFALGLALLRLSAMMESFGAAVLAMLLLCVTAAFFQNYWSVMAAIDLPRGAAARNAWLLCLLRPAHTLLMTAVNAALLLPGLLLFPLSLPAVLLLPFGLSSFFSGMLCWNSCKRYLISPEEL